MTTNATRRVIALYSAAALLEIIDITIIYTALTDIAKAFGVEAVALKGALLSYMLSLAAFVPLSKWLGDRLGLRHALQLALGIFLLGSLFCGFATSPALLSAARAFQGMGAAFLSPLAMRMLLEVIPPEERTQLPVITALPVTIGPILGPVLGGVLVHFFSWHWIFFINIPIGLGAIWMAQKILPAHEGRAPQPLDLPSFLSAAGSLGLLLLGLESLQTKHWALAGGSLALGAVLGGISWRRTLSIPNPLVNLKLFSIKAFRQGTFLMLISFSQVMGALFLMPILMQKEFGYSGLAVGAFMIPRVAGSFLVRKKIQQWLEQNGFAKTIFWGAFGNALAHIPFLYVTKDTHWVVMGVYMTLLGITGTLFMNSVMTWTLTAVPREDSSSAGTLNTILRQLFSSTGVSLAALAVTLFAEIPWAPDALGGANSLGFQRAALLVLTPLSLLALPVARSLKSPKTGLTQAEAEPLQE